MRLHSGRPRATRIQVNSVERRMPADVQAIPRRTAEADIGPVHKWLASRQDTERSSPTRELFFDDADHAVPTGNTYSAKEALTTVTPFLTANPEVNLFIHVDQGIEGVGDVIQNLKLQGKVCASGFNVSSAAILEATASGSSDRARQARWLF
jgi:hypothetical protein